MMQCDTIKEMLSDYIDDSIEPGLKSQINEHLGSCPDCSKLVQQVRTITTRLSQTQSVKTSIDFDKNLRARIMGTEKTNTSSIPFRGMIYGLSGVTAAVAVYFITTTTIFSGSSDSIQPVNFQTPTTSTQPNQITRQQPQVNIQPVNNTQDMLVVDSTKSKPAPLENRDINLVGSEK
jgi:predicted anti-sigma-YlaC factor YlaD